MPNSATSRLPNKQQYAVLDVVEHFARERGYSPCIEEIARDSGMGKAATRRAVDELATLGFVIVHTSSNGKFQHVVSRVTTGKIFKVEEVIERYRKALRTAFELHLTFDQAADALLKRIQDEPLRIENS